MWGAAATIAVLHDVLVTLAFLAVFRYEITLNVIAALLTLVGYSVNDTIVIFDRARENLRHKRKDPLRKILNDSLNQTLTRTLISNGMTFLAVLGPLPVRGRGAARLRLRHGGGHPGGDLLHHLHRQPDRGLVERPAHRRRPGRDGESGALDPGPIPGPGFASRSGLRRSLRAGTEPDGDGWRPQERAGALPGAATVAVLRWRP